jgi:hypothetical protein
VKEIFIDGTFKCCPKFFEQLYTIHGYSNGHYIPLVFALLVSKSEDTYRKFLQHVIDICSARNLTFKPAVVHVDLEITVHNVFRQMFSETSIQCCRFHLGQSWWKYPINENFFHLCTEYTKIRSAGENNDMRIYIIY